MSARRRGTAGVERWVIAWVALIVSGTLLALAARAAGPLPGDLAFTRLLQKLPPDGVVGLLLSYAGGAIWFLPVAALAVAVLGRRWVDAVLVLLAGATGALAGDALKLLVARPRPPVELAREVSEGYGFPSSTVLFVVVLLGAVCYVLRDTPRPVFVVVSAASSLLVIMVGLSRVYVGEHWATDVVGGWLFGAAWLIPLAAAHRWWSTGRAPSGSGPSPARFDEQ